MFVLLHAWNSHWLPTQLQHISQLMSLQNPAKLSKKPHHSFIHHLRTQEAVLCVPTDRRLPKLRVRSSHMGRLIGQRFVVRCTGWERFSMYPSAHVLRVLGPLNDLRCVMQALCLQGALCEVLYPCGRLL